jgi:hypothetical protein
LARSGCMIARENQSALATDTEQTRRLGRGPGSKPEPIFQWVSAVHASFLLVCRGHP